MYRGNIPGQFNGNRLPSLQEYSTHPNYQARFSQSGQITSHQQAGQLPSLHSHQIVQGQSQPTPANSEIHSSFPGTGYSGGILQGQGPFGSAQPAGTYGTHPYNYGQGKVATSTFSSQSYPTHSVSSPHTPHSSHRYGIQNQGQTSMGYSRLSDIPTVSDGSMHQYQGSKSISSWSSSKSIDSQILPYGQRDASVDMYNGSQLGMVSGASSQAGSMNQPHHHTGAYPRMSVASSSLQQYQMSPATEEGRSGAPVPYQQQSMSSQYPTAGNAIYPGQQQQQQPQQQQTPQQQQPQYNQTARPMNPSAVGYAGQTVAQMQHPGQYPHPSMRPNTSYNALDDPSSGNSTASVQQQQQQQQVQAGMSAQQQQHQQAIKSSGPQTGQYAPKHHQQTAPPNMHSSQQQQVISGHPLQQTMSPRHTTPLSPIRARPTNPSAAVSPQIPTSSPRQLPQQQHPTSQPSPRLPSQTPPLQAQRAPSPRGANVFSPRQHLTAQQQQQQAYSSQGYRPPVASVPTSQHDQQQQVMSRGFMNPQQQQQQQQQQMMSPPPSAGPTGPIASRLHGPYNGDVMQQHQQQKSQVYSGRYPGGGSWQQSGRVPSQQQQQQGQPQSVSSNHANQAGQSHPSAAQFGMQSPPPQHMHHQLQHQQQQQQQKQAQQATSRSQQQPHNLPANYPLPAEQQQKQHQRSASHEASIPQQQQSASMSSGNFVMHQQQNMVNPAVANNAADQRPPPQMQQQQQKLDTSLSATQQQQQAPSNITQQQQAPPPVAPTPSLGNNDFDEESDFNLDSLLGAVEAGGAGSFMQQLQDVTPGDSLLSGDDTSASLGGVDKISVDQVSGSNLLPPSSSSLNPPTASVSSNDHPAVKATATVNNVESSNTLHSPPPVAVAPAPNADTAPVLSSQPQQPQDLEMPMTPAVPSSERVTKPIPEEKMIQSPPLQQPTPSNVVDDSVASCKNRIEKPVTDSTSTPTTKEVDNNLSSMSSMNSNVQGPVPATAPVAKVTTDESSEQPSVRAPVPSAAVPPAHVGGPLETSFTESMRSIPPPQPLPQQPPTNSVAVVSHSQTVMQQQQQQQNNPPPPSLVPATSATTIAPPEAKQLAPPPQLKDTMNTVGGGNFPSMHDVNKPQPQQQQPPNAGNFPSAESMQQQQQRSATVSYLPGMPGPVPPPCPGDLGIPKPPQMQDSQKQQQYRPMMPQDPHAQQGPMEGPHMQQVPRGMPPHDPNMMRPTGPHPASHYPPMRHSMPPHPGHPGQQPPPPHPYAYGPQPAPSQYPAGHPMHSRPPYGPQPNPGMGMRPGYGMGPGVRPPYQGPPMHHAQQQHLHGKLQALKQEMHQTQSQLQRSQQEEAMSRGMKSPADGTPNEPHQESPRSKNLRMRCIELDQKIRQISAQLRKPLGPAQHGPPGKGAPMSQKPQDPMTSMAAVGGGNPMMQQQPGPPPPGFAPQDYGDMSKPGEDPSATGKPKKKRKQKPPKGSKGDDEDGHKKDKAPPKKKKKRDPADSEEANAGEKKEKKKKKSKKQSSKSRKQSESEDIGEKKDLLLSESGLNDMGESQDASMDVGKSETSSSITENMENKLISAAAAAEDSNNLPSSSDNVDEFKPPTKKEEKKRKKPPATLVKPKKKRKRGYDSGDELNCTDLPSTPPMSATDDSLIEKRRSGRNVKRKRYTESIDLHFSGDEEDEGADFSFLTEGSSSGAASSMTTSRSRKPQQKDQQVAELKLDTVAEEEVLIVEKILSCRVRKRRPKKKPAPAAPAPAPVTEKTSTDDAAAVSAESEKTSGETTTPSTTTTTVTDEKLSTTTTTNNNETAEEAMDVDSNDKKINDSTNKDNDETTAATTAIKSEEDNSVAEAKSPVDASTTVPTPAASDAPPAAADVKKTEELVKTEKEAEKQESSDDEDEELEGEGEDEFYIKFKNYSYLHCEWKLKSEIEDKRFDQKLKRYLQKHTYGGRFHYPEHDNDELFNPDFVEVDRVLDVMVGEEEDGNEPDKHYLVKWCSLSYEDSTWEREADIGKSKIAEFEERCSIRPPQKKVMRPHKDAWKRLTEADTRFRNNNKLRDYQFEGVNWLLFNWYNKRNCILADEMGLGKTIQSITFLQKIFDHNIRGPFLIVAPLSTIANWQREFESWTSINAIIYHGSQTSRDMIRTYEWLCRDENLDEIEGAYKMQAVITTYEMIVLETPHLMNVEWKCLIIDEAHRLKNLSCKLVECLRSMSLEHKVLLTGTPLQNNVEELFALLSFLQPETFHNQNAFSSEFGNLKDQSQVEKLQELLKPMMLRRLKGDVEKSLAPKQETIIEVELTSIQKKYYRAILERNFEFLSKGAVSGNIPNLMNTMMELRKCCNHPYLIKGAEDKITDEQSTNNPAFDSLQAMIQSSGKLVLIDKLLPRLHDGGHKVLVFSQMVKVLDILEDYLVQRSYLYERLDGGIRGNERQMAIDRFSRKGSDRFVFLLCTRAGGLGINLTAADTVIIFDSDWNPQNDLQAQARCHRIGQSKPVKIYRLITRNSYEREMFDKASLKLGLDKAVLQSMSGPRQVDSSLSVPASSAPQLSKKEVEDLLKKGAYGAVMEDDEAASRFCEEDIDQILDRRAHTVTLESGEKGSTFSKASFVSAEDNSDDISLDDPNFWEKWAKKADLDVERMKDNKLIIETSRSRKQTRRFGGGNTEDPDILAEIGSDSDDSEYESGGEEGGRGRKSKYRNRGGGSGGGKLKGWGRRDCFRIEKCLLTYGWGRWNIILARGGFNPSVGPQELEEMARAVLMFCLKYYNGDDKIKSFMWDLITPQEFAQKINIDLRQHEGLTAPVPRGRKGRRTKEDTGCIERFLEEQAVREWAKPIEVDNALADEGFRKHIQHQCNKVLLRVRMLHYLKVEILAGSTDLIEADVKTEDINFDLVEKVPELPAPWWTTECDKSLLIGVFRHGYEKYNQMRADRKLVFFEQVGPPDERALQAEIEVEPDDADNDPEYKPTRISFPEHEFEQQDSPSVSTPNTAPPSPSSVAEDASKAAKNNDIKQEEKRKKITKKETLNEWPTITELNARLRRIVTAYQKYNKQKQQRLLNAERRNVNRNRGGTDSPRPDSRRSFPQARWTRREEGDFYRTVSTFGIERDPLRKNEFSWKRFRSIARLDRKTDESLRSYYIAFRQMLERVCRFTGDAGTSDGTGMGVGEEVPNLDVDPITEERANRTLLRIQLLDKIRTTILPHAELEERLKLCQRSAELPIWWKNGVHDRELLIAMDRHGVTRTEIHTLHDPDLTFSSSMKEFEANPIAFKQQAIAQEQAEIEQLLLKAQEEQKKRQEEVAKAQKEKEAKEKEEAEKAAAEKKKKKSSEEKEKEKEEKKSSKDDSKKEDETEKSASEDSKTADASKDSKEEEKKDGASEDAEVKDKKEDSTPMETDEVSAKSTEDKKEEKEKAETTEEKKEEETPMEVDQEKTDAEKPVDDKKTSEDKKPVSEDEKDTEKKEEEKKTDEAMEVEKEPATDVPSATKDDDTKEKDTTESTKEDEESKKATKEDDEGKKATEEEKEDKKAVVEEKDNKVDESCDKKEADEEGAKKTTAEETEEKTAKQDESDQQAKEDNEVAETKKADKEEDEKMEVESDEKKKQEEVAVTDDEKKSKDDESTAVEKKDESKAPSSSNKEDKDAAESKKEKVEEKTNKNKSEQKADSAVSSVVTAPSSTAAATTTTAASTAASLNEYLHPVTTTLISQSQNGRWPKDRILISRVEQVCMCIETGEWPAPSQALAFQHIPGMSSRSITPTMINQQQNFQTQQLLGSSGGGSRGVTPSPSTPSSLANLSDFGAAGLMPNEEQIQAALAALNNQNMRLNQSYQQTPAAPTPSKRNRRNVRAQKNTQMSFQPQMPFAAQMSGMDKVLQQKIEQMITEGSPNFNINNISPEALFAALNQSVNPSGKSPVVQQGNSKDDDKNNDVGSSRSSRRPRQNTTASPSFSQRNKDSGSSNDSNKMAANEMMKQQQAAAAAMMAANPEQLFANNNALNQMINEAIKAGMDPMIPLACSLMPTVDPFQMLSANAFAQQQQQQQQQQSNASTSQQQQPSSSSSTPSSSSSKRSNKSQMSANQQLQQQQQQQQNQMPMLPPAELEKLIKSMGLTPEVFMMPGFFPSLVGGMMPQASVGGGNGGGGNSSTSVTSSSSNIKSSSATPIDSKSCASPSTTKEEKNTGGGIATSIFADKQRSQPKKKSCKLDAIFGLGKNSDDSGKSSKKSRKMKFISPAMLPKDTRIPVINNTEGLKKSGESAPINDDLAEFLASNPGFAVDYPALRQQLDDSESKKSEGTAAATTTTSSNNECAAGGGAAASSSGENASGESKQSASAAKDKEEAAINKQQDESTAQQIQKMKSEAPSSDESDKQKQQQQRMKVSSSDRRSTHTKTPDNVEQQRSQRQSVSSPALRNMNMKQHELEMAAMLQMASMSDPNLNLMSLPPEVLANLAGISPDKMTAEMMTLLASGLLPGGMPPEMLAAVTGQQQPQQQSSRMGGGDDGKHQSRSSPSVRSGTPAGRSGATPSPSLRHSKHQSSSGRSSSSGQAGSSNQADKPIPNDPSMLKGDERISCMNLSTGRKLTGRQAPELKTLADYLRAHPEVYVAPEWHHVLKKSTKYLPKDLHSRALPPAYGSGGGGKNSSSAPSVSAAEAASIQATLAASGIPPQVAASMYPGLLQGAGGAAAAAGLMNAATDPLQLMMALQQLPPAQQQQADMKNMAAAVAASSMPFLHFFGGMPNPMMGAGGFAGQDPTMAALAAISNQQQQQQNSQTSMQSSSSQKKEHSRNSSDSQSRNRKPKKEHNSRSSSSMNKQQQQQSSSQSNAATDPMAAALAMLQRQPGAGFPGVGANAFLGANPMMYPQMMMGGAGGQQGANAANLLGMPMELMNPDLLAAQMAAFAGFPMPTPPSGKSSGGSGAGSGSSKNDSNKNDNSNRKSSSGGGGGNSYSSSSGGSSKRKDSQGRQQQQQRTSKNGGGGDDQPMDLTHLPATTKE